MKFADKIIETIIANEKPRVEQIMAEMANKIQNDFVTVTYGLLDRYYESYSPQVYIRTDEYKRRHGIDQHGRKHDKKGKVTKTKSKTEKARARDVSLKTAMTAMVGGVPAIGVARGNYENGYIAGVVFDEAYFMSAMKHSIHGQGFDEMDIVSNFLFSADGNLGYGNIAGELSSRPSAATELDNYLSNYGGKVDKYYNVALNKLR